MADVSVIALEGEKEGSAVVVDEQGLIRKAARGDSRALSELLQQHYSFLYQYALKLTMNRSYAEDVTQETMLRAIEKIGAFQGKAKFSTWLITIASRIYVDRIRSKERERRWVQEEQTLRAIRYETQTVMGDWPEALDAIGRMPGDIRMAVLLKYYYGYAQEEISSMLDLPVGTVKSRLHNGLKQLRKELGDDGQS
ncbi:RNA polymerase sigma factor SigY [Paenibacillus harenae]|uniref:RNA polymerase sigma factor n=1 Tax=Paenibacillus harenae TaxID=306543 RepID=A0ABT9U7K8_PAEHA|nr:RNA polymerase sigma factor SigY [Paenibacillus harenae]MDQ0115633.1 RNA polymerase sigma-70 factor (ECF subfamily) [Paenibacillus harenae]